MYTAGIVTEFNPFHRGHEYLIQSARKSGATHIAVVMSGACVQRGEPAVCSKHERAEAALRCGADLVAELPAPFSCSSARYFADAAVQILGQLNIHALAFGSETQSVESLLAAAKAMDELADSDSVKKRTARGMSYPAAIHAAVSELYGADAAQALATPNSTLGVEYVRALMRNGIKADVIPVKRVGSQHDGRGGEYPSGSELREILLHGGSVSGHIPAGCAPKQLFDPSRASDILLYRLLTADREDLLRLPEINDPIIDRILKVRRDPPDSYEGFLAAVKSANITLARLRRSALHLALGVTREDIMPPPYVRVLAFNKRGTEILRAASPTVPLSVSLKDLRESSPAAARIIGLEDRAVRFQQMCGLSSQSPRFENEYTRKVTIFSEDVYSDENSAQK